MMKSRSLKRAVRIARMEMRNAYTVWIGNLEGKNHSEDLGVDGRMSERILGK
jgi:hypothetical protein